jgi:hypothetical protein
MIVGFGTLLPTFSIQFKNPLFGAPTGLEALASDMALILSMRGCIVQAFRRKQVRLRDSRSYV